MRVCRRACRKTGSPPLEPITSAHCSQPHPQLAPRRLRRLAPLCVPEPPPPPSPLPTLLPSPGTPPAVLPDPLHTLCHPSVRSPAWPIPPKSPPVFARHLQWRAPPLPCLAAVPPALSLFDPPLLSSPGDARVRLLQTMVLGPVPQTGTRCAEGTGSCSRRHGTVSCRRAELRLRAALPFRRRLLLA